MIRGILAGLHAGGDFPFLRMATLLNLGIICGNIEPHLFTRFLDNFTPLADRIAVVFAPGNAAVDARLVAIARERGVVTGCYTNRPGNDWSHVDDFAAARNAAFDLAASLDDPAWIMWADTDDPIEPEACETIRAALAKVPPTCTMMQLPYRIPYQSVTLWRERIIRPGGGVWKSPVHEFLAPTDPNPSGVVRLGEGVITHAPEDATDRDDGRNLRILLAIPLAELTTSHRYHLCQEHLAEKRTDEAIEYGMQFIGAKDAPAPEVYDIALTLSQVTSAEQAAVFRSLALIKCPERREAYYEFAHTCLANGEGAKALAWCRAAEGQPVPAPENAPWNHRHKMYGWAGVHLRASAERASGNSAHGDAIEYNFLRKHGPRISLIHATRGRPQQATQARGMWLERAKHPEAIEHIFVVDDDDDASIPLNQFRCFTVQPAGPVNAWNVGAKASCGDVIIQMSDDWEPPQDWDSLILSRLDTTKPQVLRISDGSRGDGLICMAILTREYFRTIGKQLFHPAFHSMFSDNWFTEQAERARVIVDAQDIIIRHLHPMLGHGEMDETYARSNALIHYAVGFQLLRLLKAGKQARTWREVDGWGEFGDVTADAFHHIPPGGTYVEVGVAFGRNLAAAAACADFLNVKSPAFQASPIRVIGVDTFAPGADCAEIPCADVEAQCRANLDALGLAHAVELRRQPSIEAAGTLSPQKVSVLCLDAAHDYASVAADLAAWHPAVAPGGIMFGHDIDAPEVARAVHEFAAARSLDVLVRGECWWIQLP